MAITLTRTFDTVNDFYLVEKKKGLFGGVDPKEDILSGQLDTLVSLLESEFLVSYNTKYRTRLSPPFTDNIPTVTIDGTLITIEINIDGFQVGEDKYQVSSKST